MIRQTQKNKKKNNNKNKNKNKKKKKKKKKLFAINNGRLPLETSAYRNCRNWPPKGHKPTQQNIHINQAMIEEIWLNLLHTH